MDDASLALKCASGDEDAWAVFLSRHADCIHTAIKKTLVKYRWEVGRDVLEDVFGEVFLLLIEDGYRRLRCFEGRNGSKLSTYLWVLASRAAVDYLRRQKNSPALEYNETALNNAADDREQPGGDIEKNQRDAVAAQILASLTAEERFFVKLHYEEGMSTDEVARTLGVSPSTVYSKKNRVRKKMQDIFRKKFSETAS